MSKPRPAKIRSWQVTLILTLFFIAVAGAAGIGWWYARESPPHQGPIVLISVDGLAAGRIPARPETDAPKAVDADAANKDEGAIAALAADAVIFGRAYTHSTQMLPAHASMLSGQLPFEHGVRDDAGFVLDDDVRTLAELLRNRGFGTGAAVSSFLLRRETGVGRGFSFYGSPEASGIAGTDATSPAAPTPANVSKDDSATVPAAAPPVDPDAAPADRDTIELATRWAADQRGRRYFLMLQVDAADADRAVGRIVDMLRERRQYDDATIVLIGDRGQTAGRIDEDTLHVPLLVKQPQREGAGRYVDAPVQHIDVLPTILDLVRAPIPGGIKGRSLKPLLTESDGRVAVQPIYSEAVADAFRFGGNPLFALTQDDVRYVRSSVESLVRISSPGAAPAPDPGTTDASAEVPPLRATLDRLISGHPVPRAAVVRARDRVMLALAGALPGLQQIDAESTLTEQEQQAIAAAHREAALAVGQRRLPAAVRTLQQIARSHPTLAAVHYQIGLLSSELGRTQDAITAFESAAALRPDSSEVLTALALALAPSQPAEAQRRIDLAIEAAAVLGPMEVAAVHEAATRIALARNDDEQAEKHAEAVQSARPEVPMRAFVQGWQLARAGNTAEAERVLQEAAAMLRQHDVALEGVHLALGEVLLSIERPADAEGAFRAELMDYPNSVAAFTGLAKALHASEKLPEADQTIAALLASVPTPEGYAAAARLYTAFGNPARAAELRSDARGRFPAESSLARAGRVKSR